MSESVFTPIIFACSARFRIFRFICVSKSTHFRETKVHCGRKSRPNFALFDPCKIRGGSGEISEWMFLQFGRETNDILVTGRCPTVWEVRDRTSKKKRRQIKHRNYHRAL